MKYIIQDSDINFIEERINKALIDVDNKKLNVNIRLINCSVVLDTTKSVLNIVKEHNMMNVLNKKETFNGVTYHGRTIKLPYKDEAGFEELTMFETGLADVLLKDDEYVSEEARNIDERIFCYVPKEILKQDDSLVIQWCVENNIDL